MSGVEIRRIPLAPDAVEGVFERGACWVPVLDVPRRLGRCATAPRPSDELVLVRAGHRLVALRSERALVETQLDSSDLEERGTASPVSGPVDGTKLLASGVTLIQAPRALLTDAEAAELEVAVSLWGPADQA